MSTVIDFTDEALIGYCELHCETPRALFHANHINRMIALAGYPKDYPREVGKDQFYSMHETMQKLCERARRRLRFTVIQGGQA